MIVPVKVPQPEEGDAVRVLVAETSGPTVTAQVAVLLFVSVSVTVEFPTEEKEVEKLAPEPVGGEPPPDQEYVPLPPEAVKSADSPVATSWEEGLQVNIFFHRIENTKFSFAVSECVAEGEIS